MQFLPSSYLGYPSNTSSAQPGLTYALDQQQQQHQQQQQQPTATALSYPSSNMQHGFPAESYAPQPTTAAAAAPATTENNAQGKPKRKQVKNACGKWLDDTMGLPLYWVQTFTSELPKGVQEVWRCPPLSPVYQVWYCCHVRKLRP